MPTNDFERIAAMLSAEPFPPDLARVRQLLTQANAWLDETSGDMVSSGQDKATAPVENGVAIADLLRKDAETGIQPAGS